MNDLNNLFGNVFGGCWAGQTAQQSSGFRNDPFAALGQQQAPVPVMDPEERRQVEIKIKNRANYALWLARTLRDPLSDCEAMA